jgi:tripartite-type tricarboxylate transporter receptor subunit TctC
MPIDASGLTLIVPFPPGGSTDFTARVLAGRLAEMLGRPVAIETRTGDLGYNAVRALLEGPAQSTFLVGNINANSVTPVIQGARAAIDQHRVMRPVTRLAEFPSVVCTHAGFPADTLGDFLAVSRRSTGRVRYGTDFLGTYVDVDMIRLCEAAGLDRACMTTDGALGILADLEARRIDLAMLNVATATANPERLKPLAVSAPERLGNFPDTPTMAEAGFAGIGTSNWQGLFAQQRASGDTVAALHRASIEAMGDPDTVRRFAEIDARVALSRTPGQFEHEIDTEAEGWARYRAAILATALLN